MGQTPTTGCSKCSGSFQVEPERSPYASVDGQQTCSNQPKELFIKTLLSKPLFWDALLFTHWQELQRERDETPQASPRAPCLTRSKRRSIPELFL
jgi:hypothetical protein